MIHKRPGFVMVATMVVSYFAVILTLVLGWSPTLGLDLQGGISVSLQPVENGEVTDDVTDAQLDRAIEIIRRRVDALGVAEPEVSRQGKTIQVQLPGAKDQEEVLEVIGQTARLEFRPVLSFIGPQLTDEERTAQQVRREEIATELGVPDGVTAEDIFMSEQTAMMAQQDPETGEFPEMGEPLNEWGVDINHELFGEFYQIDSGLGGEVTPEADRSSDNQITLATDEGDLMSLGPVALTGDAVETATAVVEQGAWQVSLVFHEGENAIDAFNAIAAECYSGTPTCPVIDQQATFGQLAIVLDDDIISWPSIQNPSFDRDVIRISGDFSREEAEAVAVALRYGSLPIELEPQAAGTVSATLGQGALQAGMISGAIGIALAAAYMLAYYRLLAVITIGSLTISASFLWVVMAGLGATVTLAGLVGVVVSVGVTVDSTIVYFEGIKERVRSGMSFRVAVDTSFDTAFATIVKANMSSLIGAGILYWLAIGPVRGFAFFLGAMTLLNLIATYWFVYPATVVLARTRFSDNPENLGIPLDDVIGGPIPSSIQPGKTKRRGAGDVLVGAGDEHDEHASEKGERS